MSNKIITLSSSQSLNVETDSIQVNNINLASDDSGTWNLGVRFNVTSPDRGEDASVRVNEHHQLGGRVTVTRAEIAAAEGIAEEDVRGTLTLEQTETVVTTIALGKLLAVLGLSA